MPSYCPLVAMVAKENSAVDLIGDPIVTNSFFPAAPNISSLSFNNCVILYLGWVSLSLSCLEFIELLNV